MMRPHTLYLLVPAIVLLGLVACGSEPPHRASKPAAKAPSAAKSAATTAAQAEAELEAEAKKPGEKKSEESTEYVYNPIGKHDPFRSPFMDIVVVRPKTKEEQEAPLRPLQRWGIEQLTLRATVTGTGTPMAMLVDPEGVGHVVRRGDLVGKNWGKVTAIRHDCVIISEQLRDASGAVTAVKSQRCLPKTQQEEKLEEQLGKGS